MILSSEVRVLIVKIPDGYVWAKVTDLKPGDVIYYPDSGRAVTIKGLAEKDGEHYLIMNDGMAGGPDYVHRTLLSAQYLKKW
jgi:hypothetical protein